MNWSLYTSASAAANKGISDVYGIRAAIVLQLGSFELSAEVDSAELDKETRKCLSSLVRKKICSYQLQTLQKERKKIG